MIDPFGPTIVILAAGRGSRYSGCKPLAPVGLDGEAIIDVVAGDAVAGGFRDVVVVVNPETGPVIRAHVEQTWPSEIPVAFAEQAVPLGTVHAAICAAGHIDRGRAFAIANADDIYGREAFSLLARHLSVGEAVHALVAFRLAATVHSRSPVNRGICAVGGDGLLHSVVERRQIATVPEIRSISSLDGHLPVDLDATAPVSMNLWGFDPSIWSVFDEAMRTALFAGGAGSEGPPASEVLLPEVVGRELARSREIGSDRFAVRVLQSEQPCYGVTHADDLALVRELFADEIATAVRPPVVWAGTGPVVASMEMSGSS